MSDVIDRIAELFDEEPEGDTTGALRELAEAFAHRKPRRMDVRTGHGRIIARLDLEPSAAGPGVQLMVPLDAGAEAPRFEANLTTELDDAERPAFLACARAAVRTVVLADLERTARRRIEHLGNELAVIQASHKDTVADMLEAREEQARDQREYVTRLEAEVEKRSAALREALRRAEQANEAKTTFLTNMSHEIRTPMTAILGYADLLLDPEIDRLELEEYLGVVKTNGEHLLRMFNQILEISKIDTQQIVADRVGLEPRTLVDEVVTSLRTGAGERGLYLVGECDADVPVRVLSDPSRVRQILSSLAGNALKFTERGGIRIVTRYHREGEAEFLLFEVIDTGIGFTAEERERLFEPFTQGDGSSTRRFGGTGLGLSIALRLARFLGGDISATSTPGRGSTFRISISVASAAEPSHGTQRDAPTPTPSD